jgi:hypothetical protein
MELNFNFTMNDNNDGTQMEIFLGGYMMYSFTIQPLSNITYDDIKRFFENKDDDDDNEDDDDDTTNTTYLELYDHLEVTYLSKKSGNYVFETTMSDGSNIFRIPINKHNSEKLYKHLMIYKRITAHDEDSDEDS